MDSLTFLVRLVEALAWPAVVAFVFWRMREPLGRLIGRLISLKYKGAELAFAERLDVMAEVARNLPSPPADPLSETKKIDAPALAALAELPPAYVIEQAHTRLVNALVQAAHKRGLRPGGYIAQSPQGLAGPLQLPPADARLLAELTMLRNKAVHGLAPEITPADALRYRDLAERLAQVVESRDARPPPSAG